MHCGTPYGDQSYGTLSSTENPATFDARNGYRNERSSVESTNLGNLAYASTLSRPPTSSKQGYPQDNSSQYGLNATESASRGDGRTTSGFGTDLSRRLPPTNTQYTSHHSNINTGRSSPAQPQYSISSPFHQLNRQYTHTQQVPEWTASRTAQDNNKDTLRNAANSNANPRLVFAQDSSYTSAGHQNRGGQDQPQPQSYNADSSRGFLSHSPYPPARPQQPTTGQQGTRPVGPLSGPQLTNVPNARIPVPHLTSQTNKKTSPSNKHAQIQKQPSPKSTPVQEHYSATVDPSQVFNDIEYRRRKDEDIRKRQTVEAARNVQAAVVADTQPTTAGLLEDTRLQVGSPPSNDILEAATSTIQGRKGSESTTIDQMELEMKQMIEKMRDYKAKDPSLFSQIWEQVKKGQVPQASSSKPAASRSSASPTVTNGQLNSPTLDDNLAESEPSTASSFPPGFDRGRFPYQRRRRGGLVSASYKHSKSHRKVPVLVPEQPPNIPPQESIAPLARQALNSTPQSNATPLAAKGPIPTPQRIVAPLTEQAPTKLPQVPAVSAANTVPATSQTSAASREPVAQMFASTRDDTDHRLLAAMQNFHQSLSQPTPPPAQNRMPPKNLHKPTVSGPTISTPTPAHNASPAAKPFEGKTQWPENKKRALAEAAITFLKRHSANAGNPITAVELHELLDQNPSYTEMCEFLSQRGFVVERGHFARFLLNAVPDMEKPSVPTAPKTPLPTASLGQQLIPLGGPKPPGYNFHKPPTDRPIMGPQQVYIRGKVLSGPVYSGPNGLPRPPTKEDKARKRNFSEIVDLTRELSEDEKNGQRQKSSIGENAQYLSVGSGKITVSENNGPAPGASRTAKQELRNSSMSREHLFKEQVSEPMDKRRDARRCSSYDSKTIARDILISSGKHPSMAPLNHHLDILREKFGSVNHDTDLSTFKWNIVDPPEKSLENEAPSATLADIMNQNGDLHDDKGDEDVLDLIINPVGKVGPSRRGRPKKWSGHDAVGNPNGTGPKTALQFDTRGPPHMERATNRPVMGKFRLPKGTRNDAHVATRNQQAFVSNGQSQTAVQSKSITPAYENPPGIIQHFGFTPVATSTVSFHANDATRKPHPLSQVQPIPGARCLRCRRQHSVCDSHKPCLRCKTAGIDAECCIFDDSTKGNITPGSSQRKGGRPPGAKNKNPRSDKGIPKGPKTSSVLLSGRVGGSSLNKPSPQRSSEPRSAISPTSSIAVVIQQVSPHANGSKIFDTPEVTGPVYRSYKCNWDHCPAELHNLETLRKHVRKHRKGAATPIPCRMLGCALHSDFDDEETWLTFEDEGTWDRHIERKHIRMLAKSQGDIMSADSDEEHYD